MSESYTDRGYLDALADHVVVFDGANGTQLQQLPLTAEDFGGERRVGCFDALALTRPDLLEQLHAGYFAAGSEVVETNTFRANRITLREYGLQERVHEINRAAAQAARRAADRHARETGAPRFVAGSMGPSGTLPASDDPVLSNITFDELAAVFREQAAGLIEGGVDVLLIETSQDLLEVKAAVAGVQQAFAATGRRIPLQCQVTLDVTGRMLLGTDVAAALATLEALPVDVVGINCSTGPEHMREPVRYLCAHTRKPVSCLPNAGLPLNVDGQAVYPLEPEPFAEAVAEFVREYGVNAAGGCCGTTPEHIRALVARLGDRAVRPREVEPAPMIASMMRAVPLIQTPPPLLIGERVSSQGSKVVKRLLLSDDYDGILQIARDQVEGGAHALDVCVALTERADEAEQMRRVVRLLASGVEAPLVIDSTEIAALEAALKAYPGRAVVNPGSLLDGGPERVAAVLSLVKAYGAALVAMTIDEAGMAKTAARKLEIAQRIHALAVNEHGLAPEDLIFDALTFTLATGQDEFATSAVETIEGVRLIKRELPGVLCSLGVSNLSFGFKPAARGVLNSVFLYHCVAAGLDMAIVNPKHITPYAEIPAGQRELADDLIFHRRPDALARFVQFFESAGEAPAARPAEDAAVLTAEERIHYQILHRKQDGVEALIDDALTRHDPVWVLNNVLLPAMKDVGDRFGAGELILPFVLQSAEVMKKAVRHLEGFLERHEGSGKGKIVLATVYGDVHDIGKSLVNTILSNNGYTVFDLGKQVPANVIIDRAVEVGADAIGLSALLVSTSKQMPLVVQELHRRGLAIPVLIGGAAINRRFGLRALFVEPPADGAPGVIYAPGVFYCRDAFEGLETLDRLVDPARRAALVESVVGDAYVAAGRPRAAAPAEPEARHAAVHPYRPVDIPRPPFWGARTIRELPLQSVFPCLDLDELFRLSWGAKNAHGAEWDKLRAEFARRLERMQREALRDGYLAPKAVYGYFPCNAEGDSVVVYDPAPFAAAGGETPERNEIARFRFPRQPAQARLCLADYFAPRDSGRVDVLALQVVTVGPGADARFAKLQARGDYAEAYFTHGLSVQTAEAAAEYVHRFVRRELGIDPGRGKRYSWGYGACPDLEEHAQVFRLLPAERELGMSLTAAYQLVPEQSTAALVVHHPDASYFHIRDSEAAAPVSEPAKSRIPNPEI